MTKQKQTKRKYSVIRDTREQVQGGRWTFPESDLCAGTIEQKLDTGDYTLKGYEDQFRIERKGGTSEFATNITESRFERQLIRMDEFEFPFIILEFTLEDILRFPEGSGIPQDKILDPKTGKRILKVTARFLLKQFLHFQVAHRTKIILAGESGRMVAGSLFKRIIENVTPQQ